MELLSVAQLQEIMPDCQAERAALFQPWLNKSMAEFSDIEVIHYEDL